MCFSSVKRPFGRYRRSLWWEDVYVWRAKRIRFTLETYTFSSQDVYVLFGIGIRLVWESYTSHFSTLKGRPFERIIRSSPENTLSTCRLHRQAKERIPKMRYTTSLQSKKECYNKRSKNIFSSTTLIDLSTAITTFASVILKLMQYDEIYPPYVSPTTRTIFLRWERNSPKRVQRSRQGILWFSALMGCCRRPYRWS